MMIKLKSVLLIVVITLLAFSNNSVILGTERSLDISEKAYSLNELQKDFKQLQRLIETKNTLTFADKAELARLFETQYGLLQDGMGELEFYRVVSPVVSAVRCGHTNLSVSKEYEEYLKENARYIPLKVKLVDEQLYIIENLSPVQIPEGSKIVTINERPVAEIINTLRQNLTADGLNETKKTYIINHWFNAIYYYYVENPDFFTITYQAPYGSELVEVAVDSIKDAKMSMTALGIYLTRNMEGELYSKAVYDDYAVLTVKTFGLSDKKAYRKFIDEFFKELEEKKITKLVLDFRGNWGGAPGYTTYRYSYLISKPEMYFDQDLPWYFFFYKRPVKPQQQNRFTGEVYTLVNGACFSSTGHLVSLLKYHGIGTIIGEETGGSYICTDGSHDFTLKHTKLRLHCSTREFKTAVSGFTLGRGIMPDYLVTPTLEDYLNGKDVEMDAALDLMN